MLTLNDGRSELWQWDTGRTLAVDADCSQVHFSNKVFGRSIDVDVIDRVAAIPDILLQTDKELTAWAFVGTPENGYTKISKLFKVNRRNKPADYVFTPPEQTTLGEILERLDDIESAQDPDAIKNAVEDYLDNNPIHVEETDPTVPAWAKQPTKPQYTAVEVGAMAADAPVVKTVNGTAPDASGNVTVESGGTSAEIPTALPNPHKLTFSGAVEAEYDGSEPVEVVIPEGGGPDGAATETWQLLADITLEEEVNNIETEYFATPQRKIRVVLDTLAAETAALSTPVKVRTGDVNWNRLVFFYPAPVPAVNVLRSLYEVEVLGDGKAMVAWNSVRNPDVKNGVGVELHVNSAGSGKMLLEPVDYYGNKINDEITGVQIGTYSTFVAGTRLRVWGVAK